MDSLCFCLKMLIFSVCNSLLFPAFVTSRFSVCVLVFLWTWNCSNSKFTFWGDLCRFEPASVSSRGENTRNL